jgi:hypothetical protein
MRKSMLNRKREISFNLSLNVNEVVLPEYNALKDPFLGDYFSNPIVKKQLRKTGVIGRKRRSVVKGLTNFKDMFPLSQR